MPQDAIRNAFPLAGRPILDRWLGFPSAIQARYDRETHGVRVAELRTAIYAGLALYNVYNLTSFALLPDLF